MDRVACNYKNIKKLDQEIQSSDITPITGYKFKVDSPKQSKRLQKMLFKLGYGWAFSGDQLLTLEFNELYANVHTKQLTQSSSRSYFDAHEYKEVDIDWLKKLK